MTLSEADLFAYHHAILARFPSIPAPASSSSLAASSSRRKSLPIGITSDPAKPTKKRKARQTEPTSRLISTTPPVTVNGTSDAATSKATSSVPGDKKAGKVRARPRKSQTAVSDGSLRFKPGFPVIALQTDSEPGRAHVPSPGRSGSAARDRDQASNSSTIPFDDETHRESLNMEEQEDAEIEEIVGTEEEDGDDYNQLRSSSAPFEPYGLHMALETTPVPAKKVREKKEKVVKAPRAAKAAVTKKTKKDNVEVAVAVEIEGSSPVPPQKGGLSEVQTGTTEELGTDELEHTPVAKKRKKRDSKVATGAASAAGAAAAVRGTDEAIGVDLKTDEPEKKKKKKQKRASNVEVQTAEAEDSASTPIVKPRKRLPGWVVNTPQGETTPTGSGKKKKKSLIPTWIVNTPTMK